MILFCKTSRLSSVLLLAIYSLLPCAVKAQDAVKDPFLAEHYDISATLDPAGQSHCGTSPPMESVSGG